MLTSEARREVVDALVFDDLSRGVGSSGQLAAYRELEWRRCKAEPAYFISRYARIKAKSGDLVDFEMYPAQIRLVEAWMDGRSTIAVKARQLGVTTLASVYCLWDVLFHDAAEWNVIAATEPKAKEVIERIQPTISNIPPWMMERARRRPGEHEESIKRRRDREDATYRFKAGFAKMSVMPSTERNIGGATGSMVWDEFTRHDDQERKYQLARPTFEGGGIAVIIANGNGDDFFRSLFLRAQSGEMDLHAYFFDWMEVPSRLDGSRIISTGRPVSYFGGEGVADRDEAMAAHLRGDLDCPWYKRELANYLIAEPEADEFAFKKQYPSTIEEAFFITGRSRFPAFWVNTHSASIREESLSHTERWPERGFLEEKTSGVAFNHYVKGNLDVWEMPKSGETYALGCDPAGGKQSGDYSVIEVFKGLPGGLAEQAAEYRAKVEPSHLARSLTMLARFYNEGFVVIERNAHGYGVIERVKDVYFNLYRHVETGKRFSDEQSEDIGYPVMGAGSKDTIIDRLAEWLDCGTTDAPHDPKLVVRSHALISELATFAIHDNGKTGAPKGSNDDTVMASAHALTGIVHLYLDRAKARKKILMPWQF